MRMSMEVDVPLACKLDVVAGPGSGRGYTNTEDVLEVGACAGAAVLVCCWWSCAVGAADGVVLCRWCCCCFRADGCCLCASAAGMPHVPTCLPAAGLAAASADCDWAQPGGHDAAE
jgi:hypothetical protein